MKSEGAALIAIGQRQLDSGRSRGDQRVFGVLPKAQARKRLGSSTPLAYVQDRLGSHQV
jgi:hypothetical protein